MISPISSRKRVYIVKIIFGAVDVALLRFVNLKHVTVERTLTLEGFAAVAALKLLSIVRTLMRIERGKKRKNFITLRTLKVLDL